MLCSIFQADLALRLAAGADAAEPTFLPAHLHSSARECWLSMVKDTKVSKLQNTVCSTLERAGMTCVEEWETPDGFFSVDILATTVDGQQLVVEVDGPTHFTVNQPYKDLGKTLLRKRLLSGYGWHVLSVPFFEWQVFSDEEARQEYLEMRVCELMPTVAGCCSVELDVQGGEQVATERLGTEGGVEKVDSRMDSKSGGQPGIAAWAPTTVLRGVGPKTQLVLVEAFGISTVAQLANSSPQQAAKMQARVKAENLGRFSVVQLRELAIQMMQTA
mmetsp:Transcript_45359/g.86745  ORF Transcript_45359/g.86745 Transcript_45359/m.86745 type:complete len:274 (-) Transcript_45359:27-848(-)